MAQGTVNDGKARNPDGDGRVWVEGYGLVDVPKLIRDNARLAANARLAEEELTMMRARVTNERIDQELLQQYRRAIGENRVTILGLEQELYCATQAKQEAESLIHDLEEINNGLRRQMVAMDSGWIPPRQCPPQLAEALELVVAEYHRAKAKHGEMTMDGKLTGDPTRDDLLRLAALHEEAGEVSELFTYDKDSYARQVDGSTVTGDWTAALIKELIQVANVAVTWTAMLLLDPGPYESDGRA